VAVRVGVAEAVLVGVGVAVNVGVAEAVLVGVGVAVNVGVLVAVLVAVNVGVAEAVLVGVGVAVNVGVLVAVLVGVGVDWPAAMADVMRPHAATPRARKKRRIGTQLSCPACSQSTKSYRRRVMTARGQHDYSKYPVTSRRKCVVAGPAATPYTTVIWPPDPSGVIALLPRTIPARKFSVLVDGAIVPAG
jgi:hypothetical protein